MTRYYAEEPCEICGTTHVGIWNPFCTEGSGGSRRELTDVEIVDWCVNHRSIAWEDFEERPFDEFLFRGYRCPAGSWIEGANAWDCSIVPVAIIPLPPEADE